MSSSSGAPPQTRDPLTRRRPDAFGQISRIGRSAEPPDRYREVSQTVEMRLLPAAGRRVQDQQAADRIPVVPAKGDSETRPHGSVTDRRAARHPGIQRGVPDDQRRPG